jgi:hypothetical protein
MGTIAVNNQFICSMKRQKDLSLKEINEVPLFLKLVVQ